MPDKYKYLLISKGNKPSVCCISPQANFSQEAIGQPIMDVVLEAGDLLYFPRGFIHQGDCLPDVHSLHITVSSYQRNSWGDLLLKVRAFASASVL